MVLTYPQCIRNGNGLGFVTITELQINSGWPGVLVRYSTAMKNTDACGRAGGTICLKLTHNIKMFMRCFLAARTAGQK
ncbi:MAG: hypothetical protein U5M23_05755 [Marinagarivorans sp.]|nr:hypothetical protein [Marinagarivorans sp.]